MISIEQWKLDGQYFNYQGHQIFFRDEGHGDTLVCIHGFPVSSWDWRFLLPELTKRYRVIAIDMLGFGFSDKPKKHTYSVIEQADIHVALLNHLSINQYQLIAHDFGTLIAQELLSRTKAFDQPLPTSLFAMSGSIFPELSKPRFIQKLLISKAGPLISNLFNEKKFVNSFQQVFAESNRPDDQTTKDYWQLLCEKEGNRILHHLNFFITDRKNHGHRWAEAWQTANVSIRYLAGQSDPMYGGDTIQTLKNHSQKKDIQSISGTGHFPHIEAPNKVLESLNSFL